MKHCCQFKADDIYFLYETALYTTRKLSIGFCPICKKPIAELYLRGFNGTIERKYYIGLKANDVVNELNDQIDYSARECNYLKFKSKPYGWKYGENKAVKIKGEEHIHQYACDFYGNKEVIKTI